MGQLDQAKRAQEQALQQLRQQRFAQWELKARTALGWIHFSLGDLAQGQHFANEARQAALAVNEQRQAAYASTCLGYILLASAQYEEATAAFQQAIAWHGQMQQANRRLEPLAGLAQVALAQGDLAQAQRLCAEILIHVQRHLLDRTEDAFQVYRTCYHILGAGNDPRAQAMLHIAYDHLQTRAASIAEPAAQQHFWDAIAGHREIRQAITAGIGN